MTTDQPTSHGASSRGSHQLACAAQCPRKWYYRYARNLRPLDEPEWRLGGTLIHTAVAYVYAELLIEQSGRAPLWWTGQPLAEALAEVGAGYPQLIRDAEQMYHDYKKYWVIDRNETAVWEVISVEDEYSASIGELDPGGPDASLDAERVTCKPDLVVRNRIDGLVYVPDHKSKSADFMPRNKGKLPEWHSNNEFAISWQANVNLHIVRKRLSERGLTVADFLINRMTRKPPFDFDRNTLHISPRVYAAVPRVLRNQVAMERQHRATIAAGELPAPHYWECFGKYGPCDYRGVCNSDTEGDEAAVIGMDFA